MSKTISVDSPVALKDLSFPLDISLVVLPDGVILIASEGMVIWNEVLEQHNLKINLNLPIELRNHIMKLRDNAKLNLN